MSILGMGVDGISVNSLRSSQENERKHFMKNIQLSQIVIGHYQPRKAGVITKESIQELVSSIKEQGVLQPIIVRKIGNDTYELIAGERRYRSAYEANLNEIPCVIKEVCEKDAFAIALIENIQREQLSLLEEAESLLKLKVEHFLSVDDVSKMIGKPRTTVANLIRVASLLSAEGKALWEQGLVDYGHIRAVIMLNHDFQNIVLDYVANNKLSVRETEKFIREKKHIALTDKEPANVLLEASNLTNELKVIVSEFSTLYGNHVNIKALSSGRLKVSIEFEDLQQVYKCLKEKNSS